MTRHRGRRGFSAPAGKDQDKASSCRRWTSGSGRRGKMVKQREESANIYEGAGRPELAAQEREEIVIIKEFMPEEIPAEKVRELCQAVITETGASGLRDMGKCMNALKERYPGQIDFAKASGVVKDLLK